MKAMSLKPNWVSMIASGEKTIELRSRRTNHRGPLLICATKPDGHARLIATLVECRPFMPDDAAAACSLYRPGLFAWVLRDVRAIEPFRVRGMLGLFTVELPPAVTLPNPPDTSLQTESLAAI